MIKTRLAVMMFFQYVIWGSRYVTLNTYLTQTLGFSATEAAAVFRTFALACMVSPFFVGLVVLFFPLESPRGIDGVGGRRRGLTRS